MRNLDIRVGTACSGGLRHSLPRTHMSNRVLTPLFGDFGQLCLQHLFQLPVQPLLWLPVSWMSILTENILPRDSFFLVGEQISNFGVIIPSNSSQGTHCLYQMEFPVYHCSAMPPYLPVLEFPQIFLDFLISLWT